MPHMEDCEVSAPESAPVVSSRQTMNIPGEYTCDMCEFTTTTALGLAKHKVSKHGAPNKKRKAEMEKEKKEVLEPPVIKRQKAKEPTLISGEMFVEKENMLKKLRAIESKFGKQIDYKCMCSVDTSLVKLQSELVTVIELVSLHCGERICYDGCLIIARVAETLTQHERVKPHFDLTGYPKNIEAQKTDVMQALGDVLQVCPSLAKNLTPELRLALCLGGIGVMTASSNRAA